MKISKNMPPQTVTGLFVYGLLFYSVTVENRVRVPDRPPNKTIHGHVAELADAGDLKPPSNESEGSIPSVATK